MARKPKIERFNESVLSKFQIYNSLFLTLPFDYIRNTSVLIPLFQITAKMDMRKSLTQGKLHLAFLVDTYLNMTKSLKSIYYIVLFNI